MAATEEPKQARISTIAEEGTAGCWVAQIDLRDGSGWHTRAIQVIGSSCYSCCRRAMVVCDAFNT